MFYPAPLCDDHQKLLDCIKRTCKQSLSGNNELASSSSGTVGIKALVTSEQEVISPSKQVTGSPKQATRSFEQAAKALEQATRSPQQATKSLEQSTRSPEQATKSLEQATRSPEQASKSLEQAMRSPEQATKSLEQATRSPEQATKSLEQASRSTEQAASPDVNPPQQPERKPEGSPEPSKQVIRLPDEAMTSTHLLKSLGRPLKLGIPSLESSKLPTRVIKLPKQGTRSPDVSKQGTTSPDPAKQGTRSPDQAKQRTASLELGTRSPDLCKQAKRSPEPSKLLQQSKTSQLAKQQGIRPMSPIRLPESAKQGQKLPELAKHGIRPSQKTPPNHRLPDCSRSHDQAKRSHDLSTSGRLGNRSLVTGRVKRLRADTASSSSLSKLPEQAQLTSTKTVPNESPADRLLADNRVCRLSVTPLKRASPGPQQSNGSSNQQQEQQYRNDKLGRPRLVRNRQPVPSPSRILKLPPKHFPGWRGHQPPAKNCKSSQEVVDLNKSDCTSKCDGESQCSNSTEQGSVSKCTISTEHCDSKCSSEHDGHCTSSTEHCDSNCGLISAGNDGKYTGITKCDSTGLCDNDTINRTQNTLYGNSAECLSSCGSDEGCDHSSDNLCNPRLSACSNTDCNKPMNIASQDKDPRLQQVKGVKRPCVSEDDCSKKKCCGDKKCDSRPDFLSDLPKHFSYATLYQSLKRCSSESNSDSSPVLSDPDLKKSTRQAHPVQQEHSYSVYYDTEMPLLLEQQRESPPCCSVCFDEKMWVCMMCEKVTHSWCLARPHTYCWDCLNSVGNILTDVK